MRLYQFLSKSAEVSPVSSKENTKLVIIWGGTASARTYMLRLVEKQFNLLRKIVYHLPEVEECLWKLFLHLPSTLQIIFWDKNSIDEDELAKMLIEFGLLKQKTIILDSTDEVRNALGRDEVPRTALRRQIDCNLPISELDNMEKIYRRWFEEVEKFDTSPRLLEHAASRPFSESFNMIRTLKLVGESNLNLITAQKWGMLWTDEEEYFVESLLTKGRGYVLKTPWSGLNASRTLYLLYRRLHLLLKVKTLLTGYTSEKLAKLGVRQQLYFKMKDLAAKLEIKPLYKRLYIVLSLMKWRDQKGVLNLLMLYW